MKRILPILLVAAAILASCCQQSNVIKTKIPAMPAGQKTMVGHAAAPIDTVRVGIVGLGMRGSSAVYRYTNVPWARITAICDVEPDRVVKSSNYLTDNGFSAPAGYDGLEGYKQLCASADVDLVYVCTDWEHHVPVALCAMENGKHVAIEVPSATTLKECWDLVNMSEKMRTHCVILENCCYDFFEMSALEMARRGALGEIVHVEGSYHHNLEQYWDDYWHDWRLQFNARRKGDIYPTHGLGPVAQVLGINRGDRFTTLTAMQTASFNGVAAMKELRGADCPDFQNGDLTCTMLATASGKTALIEHDVLTPRPYNRMYQLVGTKGYAAKYPVQQICIPQSTIDSLGIDYKMKYQHAALPKEIETMVRDIYQNPIINAELEEKAKKVGGHGGMDWIMDYRLCYCLHYGLPVDMDVYDLASWCCLAELGELSIDNNNAPVEVPDFTRGNWQTRDGFKYAFADGSFR